MKTGTTTTAQRRHLYSDAKPGTLGATIGALVDRHGGSTVGLYILERALLAALGMENGGTVKVYHYGTGTGGCLLGETERYREIEAAEMGLFARAGLLGGKGAL
jgi:hypothetical protein